LLRQLLTESLLLSLVGGAVGIGIAQLGIKLILYVSPNAIPRSREITLDWTVLAFTFGIAVVTGILFGLVPALHASQVDVQETLKETGRGTSRRQWLRNSLVVVEVATTMVLLIGAGLMIRSFYRLQQVNPGFSPQHLTSFSVSLPQKKYPSEDRRAEFYRRVLENLRSMPGVDVAAAASGLPLGNNGNQTSFYVEGKPLPPREQTPLMETVAVTPDYFRAMNIPLLRGRYFTDQDNRQFFAGQDTSKMSEGEKLMRGVNVIVIDEEFARRHWPNEDPIGKQIKFDREGDPPRLTVIGVVGRVRMESLTEDSNRVQGYFASYQMPYFGMTMIIKAAGDPNQLIAAAREQIKNIDPDQPIYNVRTMSEIRADSIAPERLNLTLMGIFGGIALVLAVVGIYGVMSYSVTQRTHEIGIRMAIGARPGDVFRMIMGHGMKLALIGVGIGLVGAFALTRLMATMLFGVEPTDKVTFASIAVLLTLVALLACYLPGRRATKVEPVISLRYE